MGSKIALKNAQDQEFSINHLDNAGAIAINSNDISTKSEIETTIAPFNKGFKNYIINGNFDIWQRGTSQTFTGYGSDDRWHNASAGSSKTHSMVNCTDTERALFNASYFSRTVVTSVAGVNNNIHKYQAIEDITKLAGKTATLSFWAKADGNKNIAIELGQIFGTGGTPSSAVTGIGSQIVSVTTTWQKKTITITIPNIIGKTLGTDGVTTSYTYIAFWFDAGSTYNSRAANLGQQSGTFDIAQVQLEEGSVATPFEQRPYGLELSLCQRYYEIINGHIQGYAAVTNSHSMVTSYSFKEEKRTTPTLSRTSTASANVSAISIGNVGTSGFYKEIISASSGQFYSVDNITTSAEL